MNNNPYNKDQQQGVQTVAAQPEKEGNSASDPRQDAIEQEQDTARLRSERKSVADGEASDQQ